MSVIRGKIQFKRKPVPNVIELGFCPLEELPDGTYLDKDKNRVLLVKRKSKDFFK